MVVSISIEVGLWFSLVYSVESGDRWDWSVELDEGEPHRWFVSDRVCSVPSYETETTGSVEVYLSGDSYGGRFYSLPVTGLCS